MIILAMESAATAASAVLISDDTLIASTYQRSGLTHSTTLLPMIEDMLKNCGHSMLDVDLLAVSEGPGSFTGLRIGVATAKGLAYGLDKPCIGVSTIEAMAYLLPYESGIVCVCMDARVGQVYNGLFSLSNGTVSRLCDDRAIALEELKTDLNKYDGKIYLVGDGAKMSYEYLENPNAVCVPENLMYQNAYGVAQLAKCLYSSDKEYDAGLLVPKYLRLPQAERERLQKLKEKA